MERRGRETILLKTIPYQLAIGRDLTSLQLLPEEHGVHALCQALQPLGPVLERQAIKCLALETNGAYIQETQRTVMI